MEPEDVFLVESSVSVTNQEFESALSNQFSPEYQQLANQVTETIGAAIAETFPDTFIGLANITFRLVWK